jgi:DNA-binding CsgD family transcriptional regulator
MNTQLRDFFDALSCARDSEAVRELTLRFFAAQGYPDIAFGYTFGARSQAPHLPSRFYSPSLHVLYGNCRPQSSTAPPEDVKTRLTLSTLPFFWASGAPQHNDDDRSTNTRHWVWGTREWALDLGIPSALVVPLRATALRLPGMFFVFSREQPDAFEASMAVHGSLLCVAALAAHERLCDLSESREHQVTQLSPREAECLEWLSRGLRNDRIADRMGISLATVEAHLASARRKLKSSTREQALVRAVILKLINP